ncbi:MAG: quinone-dependent dihydroorotate dehydrogenase, partial [Methyloprofundus sp.]|nr:quinone-dependent dihydroorotate dehydrogenase [Methyloprofundus sp.]
MNYYPLIKPLLFQLDPEKVHYLTLKSLKVAHNLGLDNLLNPKMISQPVTVMGLEFQNP